MSKAFTDEEASDSAVSGRVVRRAARGEERPMTVEGHRRLVESLRVLVEVERPRVRAAGGVDVERVLKDLDHRVALLQATLESVRVVTPTRPATSVRFGAVVTVEWGDGRVQRLQLVGPDEADLKQQRVSVESPLGRALLGVSVGESVEVERPGVVDEVTVRSIEG